MVSDVTTGPEFLPWVKEKRSKILPEPPSTNPFSGLVTGNLSALGTHQVSQDWKQQDIPGPRHTWTETYQGDTHPTNGKN